jgi:hypothetical protein
VCTHFSIIGYAVISPAVTPRVRHTMRHTPTKGNPIKIDPADRTPRETLEKRLEETPVSTNPRKSCVVGTTHDGEELGLCSHGLACQACAWGRYVANPFHRVLHRIWPYWTKIKSDPAGKNILRGP